LVAVAVVALVVWGLGPQRCGARVVGYVPSSLPHFQLPAPQWEQARPLAGNAFAIALLGLLEAVTMAQAIAARTGPSLGLRHQCRSEGLAKVAGGFVQCMPGSGSLTRSAINQQAGAVSQWSGLFPALAVGVAVVLFAPLAAHIPVAALAGLLMLAAF